jgi:hypothetical protein
MNVSAGLTVLTVLGSATGLAVAQDLDANKSPQQLFTLNCVACHQSPRGLAKRAGPGLASFLRQHYTSGPPTAAALAGYLNSVGGAASDAHETARPKTAEPAPATPTRIRPGEERKKADEKAAAKREDERNERLRRRAEREADRAARLRLQERTTGIPIGLTRAHSGLRRPYGEPAVVDTDPPAVGVTMAPIPTPPALIAAHAAAPRSPNPAAVAAPSQAVAPPARVSTPPSQVSSPAPVSKGPAATLTAVPPPTTPAEPAVAPIPPATAALPSATAPASEPAAKPQAPAASAPTAKAEAPAATPAAGEPHEPAKGAAIDTLPAYPPPLDLELKAPANATRKPAAQSGFSSPVP